MNNHILLVSGKAASGKSISLRNLRDPQQTMYLNCENNKALPFKSQFQQFTVTDPYQIHEAFNKAASMGVKRIIIDSLTFLMDMFEAQYVNTASDTRKAWGDYANYFTNLMQQFVATAKAADGSDMQVIFLAHTSDVLNESEMINETCVKVKGSLMTKGIEAFFTNVVSTKKVALTKLKDYGSPLLQITEDEEMLGFKYVYQTRLTKETVNERMRAPLAMWSKDETFIDNDLQVVLDRLDEYYAQP